MGGVQASRAFRPAVWDYRTRVHSGGGKKVAAETLELWEEVFGMMIRTCW